MNFLIVLVLIATFSNIIGGTPTPTIANDELMDGKYLCEGLSALRFYDNTYNNLNNGYVKTEITSTSAFLNEFYNMFLKTLSMFRQSLGRKLTTNRIPEEIAAIFAKRNLDSIAGGHLIKRTQDNKSMTD
ncbi:uncharacterized protein LOC115633910 isoform X2 [Scaptodrosophila lebanonensis]|uniref:Uncharacterized protein LOC115633910 isoform X2 n=1 Tax=Drosophila lebanonensis TaxID=7225 RepID=A0A6J2UFR7_DROLE|nr:uncharacterized protein LOC115633910 isoform X2 [Scaptodrosophila lebanonensis]